ncbi:MAG: MFS transporter [Alphaproteobacteria bacterium]|nr:MFS transporter [Alphaproteobacteria bacterium]
MSAEDAEKTAEIGLPALFRNANYLRVWILGALTGFIRWFQLLALGIYTFEITNSPFLVSVIPVLWGVPLSLCGPLIGGIADRVNRKLLLGLGIGMILCVAAVMAFLAYSGGLTFIHIAVASLFSGLFWATDMPLRRRLIGDVAGENLSAAMSLDSATNSATRMLGPLMGGVMLQWFGIGGVYALSVLVYAIGVLLILTLRLPAQVLAAASPSLIRDLAAGIRFALSNWELRRVLAVTIVFNVFGFPFTAMIPILGRDQLGLTPSLVGFLSSLEGAGAFAGGIILAALAKPDYYARIFVGGALLYLALIGYLGILAAVSGGPYHSFIAAALTLTVIGLAVAGFAAMQSTLTYLHSAAEYRSRVLGVLALCIGTGPLGFLNIGWLAETFGLPTALVVMSLEGLFAMLLLWLWGVLKR